MKQLDVQATVPAEQQQTKGLAEPLLTADDLAVEFYRRRERSTVIEGVSYEIGLGEFVGIIGETGSGKSVSLRAALRMLPRNGRLVAGKAIFRGVELRSLSAKELRRVKGAEIGFIPQQPWSALNPVVRLDKQFAEVAKAHGKSRKWAGEAARKMLRRVEIVDPDRMLAGYAGELSGGMAQRVVIAMSLLLEPALVVADEPTTALDVTVQREIMDLLSHICREDGKSVLIVTHDLGVVSTYCDRVYVMQAGSVLEDGPVRQVFGTPRDEYTRSLVEAATGNSHASRERRS